MEKEQLIKKIKALAPWYQRINLDGTMTINKGDKYISANAGEHTWNTINKFLPKSLAGARVLDLGCNAGYYSIRSSLLGAKEVVGVDLSRVFFPQALFIKEYFEKSHNKKLNINYIKSDITDLNFNELGDFDYVFAIAVLYHIGKQKYGKYTEKTLREQRRVIKELSLHTKKFIVRCRNSKYNSREYYKKMFKNVGFTETNFIPEGKRGMILYESKS
jgi:tRNA (mo5U34)-methyltransferase